MGSEMATKFLTAGYRLTVYDIDANQLQGSFASGAKIAESSTHLTQTVDVVMTSLRSSAVWETITENELLPLAQTDQIFIDFGTSKVDQTQRLAKAFQEKSATLLDVPVSGGPLAFVMEICTCLVVDVVINLTNAWICLKWLGDHNELSTVGPAGLVRSSKASTN